jgi:hypothetical protein
MSEQSEREMWTVCPARSAEQLICTPPKAGRSMSEQSEREMWTVCPARSAEQLICTPPKAVGR